jgi:hypothetical protein
MDANRRRGGWKRSLAAFSICTLIACAACGGKSSTSTTTGDVTIAISPTSVTLPVSTSQQFSASVSNATDTSITWQVNGTAGGSATYGTISSTGTYTAPASVPATSITVTAISVADTSKTATATVTVTNANKLVVTPAQATVAAGGQQTFSVALGTEAVDAVWSLSCQSSASGACGTISSTGVYTAPLSPPPGQLVSITASSKNNTANPAYAPVTVTFGGGTLLGQYSFALTGLNGGQPFTEAGSITFDGKGGITGGMEDQGATTPITITGGTYVADAQGRVTATVHTDNGDEGWQITLVNHSRALVMRVDSVMARGDLDLQNSVQFGQALSGNFNFRLAKRTAAATPVSAIVGTLAFDSGNITAGALDSNDGGTLTTDLSVSGTSTASDANGRGTLTLSSSLGTQMFAYYLTSSTSARLVEIDGASGLVGSLAGRSASPATLSQFAGSYAFVFRGANSSGEIGQGGTFTTDINGNVSNTSFDVSTDSNFQLGLRFSGAFVISDAASGRTVATFDVGGSTLEYVVYPPSLTHEMVFLEIDSQNVATGSAVRQSNIITGTSVPSLSGQFALVGGETGGTVQQTLTGTLTPTSVATGTLDVNDTGNVTLGTALQSSSFSVTSLYGRGRLQLQAGSYKASYTTYLVDSNTVLILQTDGKGVLNGAMQKQY